MEDLKYHLVHVPERVLGQKTEDIVDPLALEIQELIPQMFTLMKESQGIGLAATQIGLGKSIAVIELDQKQYVLINPVVTSFSDEKILFTEGCLSIPGKEFEVIRAERVTVRYLDEHGKKCKVKTGGLLAIVLQHEIDHLGGMVIADRYRAQEKVRLLFK